MFTQVVCMVLMAINIALTSERRMFMCPSIFSDIWVLLLRLYTHDFVMWPSTSPSKFLVGGMKEIFVYMHCCGFSRGNVEVGQKVCVCGGGFYF